MERSEGRWIGSINRLSGCGSTAFCIEAVRSVVLFRLCCSVFELLLFCRLPLICPERESLREFVEFCKDCYRSLMTHIETITF